jgi:hypothetical protein
VKAGHRLGVQGGTKGKATYNEITYFDRVLRETFRYFEEKFAHACKQTLKSE